MGRTAASANSAKTMCLAYETKNAELESQLATRNSELDVANGKVRAAEENLASVMDEKDKQFSELMSFRRANDDLKKQASELHNKLKESEQERRDAQKLVKELQSQKHIDEVVDEYKNSETFKREFFMKSFAYYNRGCMHVIRNLHHLVPDKKELVKIFLGNYLDPELRKGCDFAPFDENELREIAASDLREGRVWNAPEEIHPNFDELCEMVEDGVDIEAFAPPPAPAPAPAPEAPVPAPEAPAPSSEVPAPTAKPVDDEVVVLPVETEDKTADLAIIPYSDVGTSIIVLEEGNNVEEEPALVNEGIQVEVDLTSTDVTPSV